MGKIKERQDIEICFHCNNIYDRNKYILCPQCRRKQPEDFKKNGRPRKKHIHYTRYCCRTLNCPFSWLYKIPPKKALICPICGVRNYWYHKSHTIKRREMCPFCKHYWTGRKRKYHKDWQCPKCRRDISDKSYSMEPTEKQIKFAKELGLNYEGLDKKQLSNLIFNFLNERRRNGRKN
jgi:ribosomal protein L37AE/L43A